MHCLWSNWERVCLCLCVGRWVCVCVCVSRHHMLNCVQLVSIFLLLFYLSVFFCLSENKVTKEMKNKNDKTVATYQIKLSENSKFLWLFLVFLSFFTLTVNILLYFVNKVVGISGQQKKKGKTNKQKQINNINNHLYKL